MNKIIIKKIQQKIIQILSSSAKKQLAIALIDCCSELSRLVAGWIKKIDKTDHVFILKGINIRGTKKAHDILAVISADEKVYIIDPTIWQFFPQAESILIYSTNSIDTALKEIKKIYGGRWVINEEFLRIEKNEEKKYFKVISQNIKKNFQSLNNKTINLRPIQKKHLPLFLRWWTDPELVALTSGILITDTKVLTGYFEQMRKDKKNKHRVIESAGKTIGSLSLTHKSKKTMEAHIVIGEKKYRGKGLGPVAMKQALGFGFALGYERAYLEVRPDNTRAIKMYESIGFKKIGIKECKNNPHQPKVLQMELKKNLFENL